MRVSQAEQTAEQAFEETGNLLDQVADLKEKIAQVKICVPRRLLDAWQVCFASLYVLCQAPYLRALQELQALSAIC